MKGLVVAGIGTEVGKTFVAAILTEALQADYWKPVQAGSLDSTDTDFVRQQVSNSRSFFHPEAYRLTRPMSPHAAAELDGVTISKEKLAVPETSNCIVIEPAGGIMVPVNRQWLNIDLFDMWDLPIILVSRNYLGSINHTLMTVDVLSHRGLSVSGIIFNGEQNRATEDFILHYTGLPCLAHIKQEKQIDKSVVRRYADEIKDKLNFLRS